jgi:hypothetical protein
VKRRNQNGRAVRKDEASGKACHLLLVRCLLCFLFDSEDGDIIFLRNEGELAPVYTAPYIPDDASLHSHRRDDLKSNQVMKCSP